ncbi:hypothetical protein HDU97_003866 [Phlyctochytrium planicorne]|nr:hypothetical protein HDU97_003866 [Phlyctochytrium planicorne]
MEQLGFLRNAVTDCLLVANASQSFFGIPVLMRKLQPIVNDIPGVDMILGEDGITLTIYHSLFLLDITVKQSGDIEKVKLSYASEEIEVCEKTEHALFTILKAGKFTEFRKCLEALAFRDKFLKIEVDLYRVASTLARDLQKVEELEAKAVSSLDRSKGVLSEQSRVLLYGHGKLLWHDSIDPALVYWGSMRSIASLNANPITAAELESAGFYFSYVAIEPNEKQTLFPTKAVTTFLRGSEDILIEPAPQPQYLIPTSNVSFRKADPTFQPANAAYCLHLKPKVLIPGPVEEAFVSSLDRGGSGLFII